MANKLSRLSTVFITILIACQRVFVNNNDVTVVDTRHDDLTEDEHDNRTEQSRTGWRGRADNRQEYKT